MNPHARAAVVTSFLIMAVVGTAAIFGGWMHQSLDQALVRSLLFLGILGCVHLAGYLLYVRQFETGAVEPAGGRLAFQISPEYWPAVKFALVLDGFLFVFTALQLDGGRAFAFYRIAFVAHWIGIFLVVCRRPLSPTMLDMIYIRWGVVLLLLLLGAIAPIVWSYIGESDLSGLERLMGK
jgi:hypothetical protein